MDSDDEWVEVGSSAARDRPSDTSEAELQEIASHRRMRARVLHEIVRDEGEEELARPPGSLWWSAVTAGMALSGSTAGKGTLHHHLPEAEWTPLVEGFGYAFGFILVVLGRLQLFTENTFTAVLPLMARRDRHTLFLTARLWGMVLVGNFVGTLLFAFAAVRVGIFPTEHLESFLTVSREAMDHSALEMGLLGVPAGFLLAILVWVRPSAHSEEILIILAITYFISVGDFSHIIVGSSEAFLLMVAGEMGPLEVLGRFIGPTLAGNIVGGTGLFAVLARIQVRKEL